MRSDSRPGELRGWHSRLYLPHFDAGETPQTITFRLADSLPTILLRQWRDELRLQAAKVGDRERSGRPSLATLERQRIEDYLNRGIGPMWLGDSRIGALIADYFDRFIRDEAHFLAAVSYVEQNPVVAGLCSVPEEWALSSASWQSRNL